MIGKEGEEGWRWRGTSEGRWKGESEGEEGKRWGGIIDEGGKVELRGEGVRGEERR